MRVQDDKWAMQYSAWLSKNLSKAFNRRDHVIAFIMFKPIETRLRCLSEKALRLFLYILFNANAKYGKLHVPSIDDFVRERGFNSKQTMLRYLNEIEKQNLIMVTRYPTIMTIQLTPYFDTDGGSSI